MPKYRITSPDGRTYEVTAPEGATQAQILKFAQSKSSAEASHQRQGFMDKLHDMVFVPNIEKDRSPSFGTASDAISAIPQEIGKEFKSAAQQFGRDLSPKTMDDAAAAIGTPGGVGGKLLMDTAGFAAAIPQGIGNALSRPVEKSTGIRREIPGAIATMMIPGIDEEKAAQAGEKVASAAESLSSSLSSDESYAKAVKALQAKGVKLTPGQQRGGIWRRSEEAHKSNPFVGQAIRDAENQSITSFNKAAYNHAVAPLGEKYVGNAVGNAGIKAVGNRVSQAYEQIKPQLKLVPDDALIDDLAEIRGESWRMPEAQERQLEGFINNRILKRLGSDGSMDGETFKQVESELTHLSGSYRSSSDAAQRELGHALEDINGALRDNLERTSDPAVSERLRALNTSWAMVRRLETAAANRVGSEGVFTTGDLLSSIKRADRSVGKRAFARGDSTMQDFAQTAHKVLPNRLPDSGTTERMLFNKPGGLAEMAIGSATNPIASHVINRMSGLAPETLGQNFSAIGPSAARAGAAQNVASQLGVGQ